MFGLIPFRTNKMQNTRGEFDNFLDSFFGDDFFEPMLSNQGAFKVDIRETDNEYLVCAELPGVNKEDIKLNFKDNYLNISAKREEVHDENTDKYVRKERSYGEVSRQIYLANVKQDKICAKFENGELKIILPKDEPTQKESGNIFIQ